MLFVFIVFLILVLVEINCILFDLLEVELELVVGFFIEYSGMIFVFFFLGEYCLIVLMLCLIVILFLGGYNMLELFINDIFVNL